MKLKNFNNLLDLFFDQYNKQDKNKIFLTNLGNPKHKLSWEKTYLIVNHLSNNISKDIKLGDRCILISENRPEWLISDLAIMLAGGISVPSYTTYTTKDYEYIINDCEPSIVIVSNDDQFKKIKDRRDESKGMEKAMGRRAYASVKTMDIDDRMKAHAKKHGIDMRHKHMRLMKKYVGEGMSFTKAHNRAQKEAPVNKDE